MRRMRGYAMVIAARLAVPLAFAIGFALPAAASGADSFVDSETGDDANFAFGCPQANPCASVNLGVEAAGPGDAAHVDDSPAAYQPGPTGFSLFGGRSLVAEDFVGGAEAADGRPVIEPPPASAQGVFVSGSGPDSAGAITGFRFVLHDNVGINAGGNVFSISHNVFEDADATGDDVGVAVARTSEITGNAFDGLNAGIRVGGSAGEVNAVKITGNEFTGTRGNPSGAVGSASSPARPSRR